jgi:hypothetical protein
VSLLKTGDPELPPYVSRLATKNAFTALDSNAASHMLVHQRLRQELDDAEWILAHEKRLITLQKETEAQRSQAEQSGANTDRLRRLEHHLAGLRQNLSLD